VTPAASTAGTATGTAAVTVTPAASAAGHLAFTGTAAVTVTPSASAAGHWAGSAATTVTPSATATGHAAGTAAVTVTPSATAVGSLPVPTSFDNTGKSALQSGLASGTPFTWTQSNTSGAYAIVLVYNWFTSAMPIPGTSTASVSFGSTSLTFLGALYSGNNAGYASWGAVYGGYVSGSGTQTVSVTLTSGAATFTGIGSSYTYNAVTAVGSLQSAYGSSTLETLSVPSATGHIVWGACCGRGSQPAGLSLTSRQADNFFAAGDAAGASTVTVSSTTSSDIWCNFGLDLT
jgi:hypothetical protein